MKVALIAHDEKKADMVELASKFKDVLNQHQLYATGTTGSRIIEATDLEVHCYKSGPLGGDQQIGAAVSDNEMDLVIFLRDPLTPQPHEPDISALMRLCDVYEIPMATNKATAQVLLQALAAGLLDWRQELHGHSWEEVEDLNEDIPQEKNGRENKSQKRSNFSLKYF
ncbi:methylglyoxal synthase [Hutsoniella sourekii]|uniref:methylglyoxal synthase n=1 Tax=Hutsoniella sourekii TaxID=87650 RepID=UPI0004B5302A|nr:methylglyoxal synthase [Hutsoniella sourekii]